MNGITFNGIHNNSIDGLVYISSSRFIIPENKDQYVEVPFMTGSYLIPDNTKRDIEIVVNFTLKVDDEKDLILRFIQIQNWLDTEQRENLRFDNIPNRYFEAKIVGSVELLQIEDFDEVVEFSVRFRCYPEFFEV